MIVLNKPSGMYSHKNHSKHNGLSVSELIKERINFPKIARENDLINLRQGIVHRLDKDTTGLMVCAKNPKSLEKLQEQFKLRQVIKKYMALVHGKIYNTIELKNFFIRNKKKRTKRMVSKKSLGKEALTKIEPIDFFKEKTLLTATPISGRTHQIRLQLAHHGFPIVGDKLYDFRRNKFKEENHFYLCAYKISFTHPNSEEKQTWEIPLPNFFLERIELEKNAH